MIKVIIQNQEKDPNASQTMESQSAIIEKMNEESYGLYKQLDKLRKQIEVINGEVLLKNQMIEENRIMALQEVQNLESEFEALQHKYDRKELILQNLERKLNYYEMYITKQASAYGRNDKEADILLKKFQHEKFSGGIEATDLYKMQR